MSNRNVYVLAKALIGLIFLVAGIRKLMYFAATAGYFAKLGMPMAEVVLGITIALEIGGAILLIIGWKTKFVAIVLGVFTLAAAVIGHPFWAADAANYQNQLNHFLKNIAMVGGFLLLAIDAGSSSRK